MRRIALLTAIWLILDLSGSAGGFTCSATCLSKIASVVSVAANAKTIAAGAHKLRHPKQKRTK